MHGPSLLGASVAVAALASCGGPLPQPNPERTDATSAESAALVASPSTSAESCADPEYTPVPIWSGRPASLPVPPTLPDSPTKVGDAFTVSGAVHLLNSRFQSGQVTDHEITIEGYIVDSNLARANPCGYHAIGKADPPGCTTPVPTFTLADAKSVTNGARIDVMGWASNFANVFGAHRMYAQKTKAPNPLFHDEHWDVDVPFPLPAVGAKVRVRGHYGTMFTLATSGAAVDSKNGILTAHLVETLEPAPEPAKLPR